MATKEKEDEQLKDKEEKEEEKSSEGSKKDAFSKFAEGEEEEEKEEEEKSDEESEEEKPAEKKVDEEEKKGGDEELTSLRRVAREQKRQLDLLSVELAENKKALQKAGLVEEDDKEAVAKQREAQNARNAMLETLAEMMRLNPKYADFDAVVTEDYADDLMEGMARVLMQNKGVSQKDATLEVEQMVWGLPNPYRFLYDSIKAHHPKFQAKGAEKKVDEKKAETSLKDLLPKKAGSIQDAAGGEGGKGGWTSAKIDALDEDELHKVPKEVYEKYLRNELK